MQDLLIHATILGLIAGLLSRAVIAWFFNGHIRAAVVGAVFRERIAKDNLSDPDIALVDLTARQINELLAAIETPRWLCRLLLCQWCCSFHAAVWSSVTVVLAYLAIGHSALTLCPLSAFGLLVLVWAAASGIVVTYLTSNKH